MSTKTQVIITFRLIVLLLATIGNLAVDDQMIRAVTLFIALYSFGLVVGLLVAGE